jgi:DNA polymerase-3 subunit alpha
MTKVQPANENFSGSVRHTLLAAMNMASARARYAKSVHFAITSKMNIQSFKEKVQSYLSENNASRLTSKDSDQVISLPMTADLISDTGMCQIQFPQEWNIYPDDRILQGFNQLLHQVGVSSAAQIKYAE